MPRMKPGLVAEAITRGARREIPMALEELYLSWQVVGGEGEQLDYFVLGVARKPVDALEQTLAQAGIKPYKLDLKPLALARAANREAALIVSLEPDYFDIVIINRGIPAIMHTITPRGPDASIADNVQRLADEISRTVEFYNGSHPGEPIDRTMPLLLTGVLAGEPSVIELTSNITGYTVSPLVPALELPDDLPLARYTTNLGLALKKASAKAPARYQDMDLNIFAAKQRTEAQAASRPWSLKPVLLTAGLVVVLIALGAVFLLRGQVVAENNRLLGDLGGISGELREIRLEIDKAARLEAEIGAALAEMDAVSAARRLIGERAGVSVSVLKIVTDARPAGSTFTGLDMRAGRIIVSGEAGDALSVVGYAETLAARGYREVRIIEITESSNTNADGSPRVLFRITAGR